MSESDRVALVASCRQLLTAYEDGGLGDVEMPEDSSPDFTDDQQESRLAYFTLPMALNYQRNSYTLWQSALATWEDGQTKDVFSVMASAKMPEDELRFKLTKHKVALQPNKHTATWHTIAKTIAAEWDSITKLMEAADDDYLRLKQLIQVDYKKGFPYLSGPKIFNYWSFIMSTYGHVPMKNRDRIEIAPDTHITKGSVLLGVISAAEAERLPKEQIANRWRELLGGSGIDPIDMHPPLWFWSRSGFEYKLDNQ